MGRVGNEATLHESVVKAADTAAARVPRRSRTTVTTKPRSGPLTEVHALIREHVKAVGVPVSHVQMLTAECVVVWNNRRWRQRT